MYKAGQTFNLHHAFLFLSIYCVLGQEIESEREKNDRKAEYLEAVTAAFFVVTCVFSRKKILINQNEARNKEKMRELDR